MRGLYAEASVRDTDGRMKRARIESDVLDIARRITDGDELWRGDKTMGLYYQEAVGLFEVWGLDKAGQPYLAASAPQCDHRLLERLVAGDWQRSTSVFDTIDAFNRKLEEDRQRAADDEAHELNDRLHWALRRDLGHLEGGTRRMTSFAGVSYGAE